MASGVRAEFAALGVPFDERARRTDEAIRVLRDLWAGRDELTVFRPVRRSARRSAAGRSRSWPVACPAQH